MVTAWCLAVAFVTPWVVGAPLLWLARGCRSLRPTDWLWVPFLGLAGIAYPLQNLIVFSNLPLRITTPWFWGVVAVAWVALIAAPSGRATLRAVPARVLGLALAVYLIQGAGVLSKGVEQYRGNLESDQFNYVTLSQFLMDEPHSTGWKDIENRPWLVMPVSLKDDRLGQSVIHGFLAVTTGRDALDLFFPTAMLSAALLCPAMLLLGRQLGLSRALVTCAAAGAGLTPGIAFLIGSCYLSHVLCIPVLVAFLAAVIRLGRGAGWSALLAAVVTFGLGFAVYTEFAPLFLGTAGAALVAGLLVGRVGILRLLTVGTALAVAPLLNPAAAHGAKEIWERSVNVGPQMTLNAPLTVWVSSMWVNNTCAIGPGVGPESAPVLALVFGCFGTAAAGVFCLLGQAAFGRGRTVAALAVASLLVPPVLLWAVRPGSAYMLCKLLWTLSPVLILFCACFIQAATRLLSTTRVRALPLLAFVHLVAILGHHSYLEQLDFVRKHPPRGATGREWNEPDLQGVGRELRTRPTSDVVIALEDGERSPWVAASALTYYGRHHRVWLIVPQQIWLIPLKELPANQTKHLSMVPVGALVVVRRGTVFPTESAPEVVFRNDRYELVRVGAPGTVWGHQYPLRVHDHHTVSSARTER